jgi:hypothetical protein
MTIQMTLPTMVFDLTEEEYAELVGTLQEIIINDLFPLSPHISERAVPARQIGLLEQQVPRSEMQRLCSLDHGN